MLNADRCYVYFAGHGEYPVECEEEHYADPDELDKVPAWITSDKKLMELSWDDDTPYGCFVLLRCDATELAVRAEALYNELRSGPRGADDDTYDYWPSGARLLRQMVADLPADPKYDQWFADFEATLKDTRPDDVEEIMDKTYV